MNGLGEDITTLPPTWKQAELEKERARQKAEIIIQRRDKREQRVSLNEPKRYVMNLFREMEKITLFSKIQVSIAFKTRGNSHNIAQGMASLSRMYEMIDLVKTAVRDSLGPDTRIPVVRQEGQWRNYASFLASVFWKDLRAKALAHAENRCQVCNKEGQLNVHHRRYTERWGEETLSDVIVLCPSCHRIFHKIP